MKGDIFDLKNISPMLLTESEPFDSKDHLYELKLDGIRCLAYLDRGYTELRNKRNKILNEIYPELGLIHNSVKKRCILDGELIVLTNGLPDFYEVQKRSLMRDQFKIDLLSKQKPVQFVSYDILYLDDKEITNLPLYERKNIMDDSIKEDQSISISRYISEKGIEYYNLIVSKGLEGVVAKRKNSKYVFGKRSKDWVKFKKMYDAEFVICGYTPKEQGEIKSISLGAYHNGKLYYQGNVSLGISNEASKIIISYSMSNSTNCPFDENTSSSIIWFKPELVCTVKYMMRTNSGHYRHLVFKGLRLDKTKEECTI